MKKTLALVMTILLVLTTIPANAISFTDIDGSHWAYPAVSELVTKGTIRGYTDGSFKPANTVSRAEFVKMVGAGDKKRANDFNDVPKTHWAYDCIMTSGFKSDDKNNFNPDKPITRAQTIELLYSRYGKEGAEAPEFVIKQGEENYVKKDAIAWIYSYGVLIGADGVNLRLGDTLTRAEAAVLIAKCAHVTGPVNISEKISQSILSGVAKAHPIFFEGATLNDTLTNAELADAIVKFANNNSTVDFNKYVINDKIDHEKSNALYVMLNSNIGLKNFNVEFANAPATRQTAELAVKNAAERLAGGNYVKKAVVFGDKDAAKPVTVKEIYTMILQYDMMKGTQNAFTTDKNGEVYERVITKAVYDSEKLPYNYDKFAVVLEGIPQEVYTFPLAEGGVPAAQFDFARDYSDLFVAQCENYVAAAKGAFGADIKITFYPSLSYNTTNGFYFRVKVTALNSTDHTAAELFEEKTITNKNAKLTKGTEFFAEIKVKSII